MLSQLIQYRDLQHHLVLIKVFRIISFQVDVNASFAIGLKAYFACLCTYLDLRYHLGENFIKMEFLSL